MRLIDQSSQWFIQLFFLLCGVLCSVVPASAADFSQCREQFLQQLPPKINNPALNRNNFPLCFNGFAVQYSGVSRTPLWSAEYLSPQRIKQSKLLKRQDNFHEETRIPLNYRSLLTDYKRSGYDRGHMSPNGDMATLAQQQDSFSLANMVPQSPHNNQEVWRNLEEATRTLAGRAQSGVYVVTGPAFLSSSLQQVGKVLVPTHIYKAVYIPEANIASAYFAPNDESGQVTVISIAALEQDIGINVFPGLKNSIKAKQVALPLNAQQASRSLKSLGISAASVPDKNQPAPANDQNQASQSSTPQGSWMAYVKHQLVALLVGLLHGK